MKRSFWVHYNKPASKKAGKPQTTEIIFEDGIATIN